MSGQNSSYLENKLRSLRGPTTAASPAQGYTLAQTAGYPTLNTVSSSLGYTARLDSMQPSFVNRDYSAPATSSYQPPVVSTAPIRITSNTLPPATNYPPSTTYSPAPVYSSPNSFTQANPQYLTRFDGGIKSAYQAPEPVRTTDSYELKANPAIYSLMGYFSQHNSNSGQNSHLPVGPGMGAEDFKRLISVDHSNSIMEKLKGAILNITEDLDLGHSTGLQDAVRTLREKLPREKDNTAKLEKACIEDLMQEEQRRQELIRQIQEKESNMRSLGDNQAILEKNSREVAALDSPGRSGAPGARRRKQKAHRPDQRAGQEGERSDPRPRDQTQRRQPHARTRKRKLLFRDAEHQERVPIHLLGDGRRLQSQRRQGDARTERDQLEEGRVRLA